MKKLFILIIFFVCVGKGAYATHIAGGELFYVYVGPGFVANTDSFKITMRLFRECSSAGATLTGETVNIGIYNTSGLSLVTTITLIQQFTTPPTIQNTPGINPCLTGVQNACYQIGTYSNGISLPRIANGYTLSWIRFSRYEPINNISGTGVGATFITQIPGTNQLPTGNNSSPQFVIKDTTIICKQTAFSLDFSAVDTDGDSLSYKFSSAYDGGTGSASAANGGPNPTPPATLLLPSINYASPYSGTSPLGPQVTLDSHTGIISGIAPINGRYVVCVVVEEWRNGILINSHRKDFILTIGDCSLTGASLNPTYLNCNDLTFNFSNLSTASNIISYLWTFGEPASGTNNTSTQPTPTHIYKDTGVYTTKLKVVATGGCIDSATTQVGVFPGFVANFKIDGSCLINPYQFTDLTVSKYGTVNNWTWDFGETSVVTDTSTIKNPKYQYPTLGSKTATLTVKDSKGCQSVVTQTVVVFDKPTIVLPFRDTLICSIDTLQLFANSSGSFTWTPTTTLRNPTTPNPYVFPKDTTTYYVTVNNNGCINTDSIKVNVLNFITVNAGLDTSICQTDTIRLHPISYALSYVWKASTGMAVDSVKNPLIQPLVNTTYYVTANLGKCQDKDTVVVTVNPYPQANAGSDAAICFGNRVQLNGNIVGNSFSWSPTTSLLNSSTLNPIAGPTKTTNYILTSTNITGCLKPVSDTIIVSVIPIITVFAGRDTTVVVNQPLQLNATSTSDSSSTSFVWSPTTGLNNSIIYNPIATLNSSIDSIRYKVRATTTQGCFGEDDILVRVYKTEPDIFVPSGFTPNGDGRNDILKPIPVGIVKLDYFNVYNRFGQLLYSSPEIGKGWDGNFGGSAQPSGTYVYATQGTDYLGKIVFRKGTAVLIR